MVFAVFDLSIDCVCFFTIPTLFFERGQVDKGMIPPGILECIILINEFTRSSANLKSFNKARVFPQKECIVIEECYFFLNYHRLRLAVIELEAFSVVLVCFLGLISGHLNGYKLMIDVKQGLFNCLG